MKKASITYSQFYNRQGTARALGGVETYILYLGRLLIRLGYEVTVYQSSDKAFDLSVDGIKIIGIPQKKLDGNELYKKALSNVEPTQGLLIFGADQHSVKTTYPFSINIMHGIAWDLPAEIICNAGGRYKLLGNIPIVGKVLAKKLLGRNRLKQIDNTAYSVLVDYNSINWYRTQLDTSINSNYKVILNFVDLPSSFVPNLERHNSHITKILFARRFHKFRGTKIMTDAIKSLLIVNNDVEITFAGEGPEEATILAAFQGEKRVKLTSYLPEESHNFHKQFDIAVVPSVASEGSSLSLAEAMGAGCAVIATDVGGMTNMIIDGFNGYLIKPDAEILFNKLNYLVNNLDERKLLAMKAIETAKTAFSLKKWELEWTEVINNVHQKSVQ